eukprot:TRINITY_DN11314_c0_g1_i1.p1 TRINITY_DN11314_c0_g1~~TRINITY_DN11314_c0_g1_i1.p1  ORF type:complete len:285 (+),score=55.09 TRINITY_DN11314_c0_g1_i1:39-893(+)
MSKSVWKLATEAAKYAQARPSHPKKIVDIAKNFLREEYTGRCYQAVDVGCGTGNSTVNLYQEFEHIIGLDASKAMIKQAYERNLPGNMVFMVSSAERIPVASESTQLIISGRAIHYFDLDAFYREVDRILVRSGVLCYYSTDFPDISSLNVRYGERIHELFWKHITSELLSPFWPVNNSLNKVIDWRRREVYLNILRPPYPESRVDESVHATRDMSIDGLRAELETYSAVVTYRDIEGDRAANTLLDSFADSCWRIAGEEGVNTGHDGQLTATDKFFLVMARKP